MIKEILHSQNISSQISDNKTNIKRVSPSRFINQPLSSNYTVEHVQAMYMPISSHAKISFKSNSATEGIPLTPQNSYGNIFGITSMNTLPQSKYTKGSYYDNVADNLAIMLGPDKNVMLVEEEGASPEILVHQFTKNLKLGKYSGQGLASDKTDVVLLNLYRVAAGDKEPLGVLNDMSKSMTNKRKRNIVVFIQDFDVAAAGINTAGNSDVNLYFKTQAPNLLIVGLMPKNELELASRAPGRPLSLVPPRFSVDSLETLGKMELNGLSVSQAKSFLRQNPEYAKNVLKRYKDVKVKMSNEAIDKIIDRTSTIIDGAFPKKALNVLDFIATAKVNEALANKEIRTVIEPEDVDKFFENHLEVIENLKAERGQFQLVENVKERFSDIGGIGELKQDIQEDIIDFAKDPEKFKNKGGVEPGAQLFVGTPGTGKTLLARIIAGESGAPFIAASGSDFVERFVGIGAQRIRELREQAVKSAYDSGKNLAFVFIDEIDAIGGKRTGGESGGSEEREATLNQLLTEMEGFNSKGSKVKIIWLAATNRKDMLDPALLSRFDEPLNIPNPKTNADRLEILSIHARKLTFANEAEKAKILNEASRFTSGISGRDINKMMKKVARIVSKRDENKFVTHNDVVEAYLQTIAGKINKQTDTPEIEIKDTIRHEGGHASFIDTFKVNNISFITLDARGDFLGAVFHESSKVTPKFRSVILSAGRSYAGGIAEPNYNKYGHGAGVAGDLSNATNIIQNAVTKWGLGLYTPPISIGSDESLQRELFDPLLDTYKAEIRADIDLMSKTAYKLAEMVGDFNNEFLDRYVQLYENNAGKGGNNLSGEEFSKLRLQWLVDTGRVESESILVKGADALIAIAQNSKKIATINTKLDIKTALDNEIDLIVKKAQTPEWINSTDKKEAESFLTKRIDAIIELATNSSLHLGSMGKVKTLAELQAFVSKSIENITGIKNNSRFGVIKKLLTIIK